MKCLINTILRKYKWFLTLLFMVMSVTSFGQTIEGLLHDGVKLKNLKIPVRGNLNISGIVTPYNIGNKEVISEFIALTKLGSFATAITNTAKVVTRNLNDRNVNNYKSEVEIEFSRVNFLLEHIGSTSLGEDVGDAFEIQLKLSNIIYDDDDDDKANFTENKIANMVSHVFPFGYAFLAFSKVPNYYTSTTNKITHIASTFRWQMDVSKIDHSMSSKKEVAVSTGFVTLNIYNTSSASAFQKSRSNLTNNTVHSTIAIVSSCIADFNIHINKNLNNHNFYRLV